MIYGTARLVSPWPRVPTSRPSNPCSGASIVLTADTYTSVLPAAQYKAAEATARLVLDAARRDRDKIAAVARRTGVTNIRRFPRADRRPNGHRRSSPGIDQAAEWIIGRGNC